MNLNHSLQEIKGRERISKLFLFSWIILQGFIGLGMSSPVDDFAVLQDSVSPLFKNGEILKLKFSFYSNDLLLLTNDSTYMPSDMSYLNPQGNWTNLAVQVRIRGGFRRTHCYFPPVKLKIESKISEGTIFQKDRKMKLVFPCLKSKKAHDNLLKEFMAYKIYEVLSEYHFKTRLFESELNEIKNKKVNKNRVLGFMIQDDESFATQHEAKELEKYLSFKALDEKSRITNALFQYMIGNTDFSTVYLHNEKIFYLNGYYLPVPYDFDMSGLVNASYAVVSKIQNEELPISHVTNRIYRGFEASEESMNEVRAYFLEKEPDVFNSIDSLKPLFDNPKEFETSKNYIKGFYTVLHDDKKFKKRIMTMAREE